MLDQWWFHLRALFLADPDWWGENVRSGVVPPLCSLPSRSCLVRGECYVDQRWYHSLLSCQQILPSSGELSFLLFSTHQTLPFEKGGLREFFSADFALWGGNERAPLSAPSVQQILLSEKTASFGEVFHPWSLQADQARRGEKIRPEPSSALFFSAGHAL
jgi:hypothetical protein